METVLHEPEVNRPVEAGCACGQICSEAKTALSGKLEGGKLAAERLMKRSQHALEGCVEEGAQEIKRHPFRSFAIAFAAGAAFGVMLPRLGNK